MNAQRRTDGTFPSLTAAREWFRGNLFNLAVDYWPFVPWRPYGSGATRKNILPVLKKLQPGFLQIYAKGETGHTSFRSSLRSEHPSLAKDLPRLQIHACLKIQNDENRHCHR